MPSAGIAGSPVACVPAGLPTGPGGLQHHFRRMSSGETSASVNSVESPGHYSQQTSSCSTTSSGFGHHHPVNLLIPAAFNRQTSVDSSQSGTLSPTALTSPHETVEKLPNGFFKQSSIPSPDPVTSISPLNRLPSRSDSDQGNLTISGWYATAEKQDPGAVAGTDKDYDVISMSEVR